MAILKRLRYEVLRRDGHRCHYCGVRASAAPLTVVTRALREYINSCARPVVGP
jgi:hypothetical protein